MSHQAFTELRRQMPVAGRWAYFDHAAVAPLSGPALAVLSQWAHEATYDGDVHCPRWAREVEVARAEVARLLGAEADLVAFVANTTAGVNIVAEGFPWRAGDNVVIRSDEFPANQYPWLHVESLGVECRRVPCVGDRSDLERIAAAIDGRTRIVAVSWVGFSTGFRHDLDAMAELAHRRGALLFVDAIQGLGVYPLDVGRTPVDFLSADGHKWLLGPEGAGVFYLRREHLEMLRPTGVGWNSVIDEHNFSKIDFQLKPNAIRYEGGSQNAAGILALGASVALLNRFGTGAMTRQVLEYTDAACQRLASLGAVMRSDRTDVHRSAIVAFELPGRDPQALRRRCLDRGIVLSCRGGRLRISPHAYNNEEDLERLIEALR